MTVEIIHIQTVEIDVKEFYNRLGKGLKDLRREKNKSQTDVAEIAGCTFQQIQKYEKGNNRPTEYRSRKIIEFLGMQYEDFLNKCGVINAKDKIIDISQR